jgi:uncharacterized protein YjbI with pentapeptide repeats
LGLLIDEPSDWEEELKTAWADLRQAILVGANLRDANLSGAKR